MVKPKFTKKSKKNGYAARRVCNGPREVEGMRSFKPALGQKTDDDDE